MAEETWKTEKAAERPGEAVYKQVAPAGVATEVTSQNSDDASGALGRWLSEKLAGNAEARERVATLSGFSVTDLTALMEGHSPFPLDTDHVQRLATALTEAQVVAHADEVWQALGSGSTDYVLPPSQVVSSMSGTV